MAFIKFLFYLISHKNFFHIVFKFFSRSLSILMLFYFSWPQFFFPLPFLPSPPNTLTVSPRNVAHVHVSFIHILCLVPSPSFQHYCPLPTPLVSVRLFEVSIPLVLLCLLLCFCSLGSSYRWDHIVLVFNWLISLSIIFCSAIHADMKGRNSAPLYTTV